VFGNRVLFLVDTGAAVSLINNEVWDHIKPSNPPKLKPVNMKLVGVDGSPMQVQGSVVVDLRISDQVFQQEVIIANSLTSEGILGINFLEANGCILDLSQGEIVSRGARISLCARNSTIPTAEQVTVTVQQTFTVAACSEREVIGELPVDCTGEWIVENQLVKKPPVFVARAIVAPQNGHIPMRILNLEHHPVTVYKGTKVAIAEAIDPYSEVSTVGETNNLECTTGKEWEETLQCILGKMPDSLTDHQLRKFSALLTSYSHLFAFKPSDLGRTNVLSHRIETTGKPIRQAVRRVPLPQREEVKRLLTEMQQKEVITPSKSPWASPIILVPKKDGSLRFCVDYRKVNEVTHKDAYPIPRIDDALDTLAGSKCFSTLDLKSGYWQVEVDKEHREKTAFCTHEGLFEFNVMPFGLCNAPATFQRLMDMVLTGLQWNNCIVYIDDIIIAGKTFDEHLNNLQQVFERVDKAGLKLQPSKCHFLQPRVPFLGHIVSAEGISPDPDKTQRVREWPTPTTIKETQQFLGLASYYRRFIMDFATIASPLHKLTEKRSEFRWTSQCQEAFDCLKCRLVSAPILALPDWSQSFLLDTDASDTGIGAVLSQVQDGKEHVIAYASRSLTKAERNYCVTRRELLAVVTFLQHFRPYLLGNPFTIRTDHGALAWLQKFKEPEGQVARWVQKLQEYQFTINHRPGKRHNNADAMSRMPCKQCGIAPAEEALVVNAVATMDLASLSSYSPQDLRTAQLEDSGTALFLTSKESNIRPTLPPSCSNEERRLLQLWDQLTVVNGLLYRMFCESSHNQQCLQFIVPKIHRSEILPTLHEGTAGGHLGQDKTFSRVKECFYWPGYWNDTHHWSQTCASCVTRKPLTQSRRAPLNTITASYPTEIMAMDILGPFPESEAGNSYILVVADYFTRWMEAFSIPNQEAGTIANKLVDEVFMRFGVPTQLHSDQGRQFESLLMTELSKLLGIQKTRTTPYHPQSDGMVERFNRTLLSMLAAHCKDNPWNWEQHIRNVCFAYNSSVHSSTGFTPFYLMYGRQATLPVDIQFGTMHNKHQSTNEYVAELERRLTSAYELAHKTAGISHNRQKLYYDRNVHGDSYEPGELVWLLNPKVPKNTSKKLFHPWTGPFKVLKKLSECTYRIQKTEGQQQRQVVHFNKLKPCPKDIRFRSTAQSTSVHSSATTLGSHSQTSQQPLTPPPVGTHLELIDDDDYVDVNESPVGDHSNTTQDQPPIETRRYPTRQHRPPTRLQDYVRS